MTSNLVFTVGHGKRRPQGRCVTLASDLSRVEALAARLRSLPCEAEGWWSPHTWGQHACPTRDQPDRTHPEAYRCSAGWRAAACVVVDPDYHDEQGDHGQPTPDAAAALAAAARAGRLPGNIWSATPIGRSTRVAAVLPAIVTDAELILAATRGFGALLTSALRELGLAAEIGADRLPRSGFAIDTAAMDLARLFWRPSAIVNGERRDAEVMVMRSEPIDVRELALAAPMPRVQTRPAAAPHAARPSTGCPSSELLVAWRRWVEDHPRDWGAPGSGTCPACTRPGFGRLPAQPWRWCCWSASHGTRTGGRCGRDSTGKWIGDAVHLEACVRGCGPVDVLRHDGYLASRAEIRRRGHRIGPATLAGTLRKAVAKMRTRASS